VSTATLAADAVEAPVEEWTFLDITAAPLRDPRLAGVQASLTRATELIETLERQINTAWGILFGRPWDTSILLADLGVGEAFEEASATNERTLDAFARAFTSAARSRGYTHGLPLGHHAAAMTLAPKHPLRGRAWTLPDWNIPDAPDKEDEVVEWLANDAHRPPVVVRNEWYSRRLGRIVSICEQEGVGVYAAHGDGSLLEHSYDRLDLLLRSVYKGTIYSLEAEERAMARLRTLLSRLEFRRYVTTGAFLERSAASQLTYVIRRGRPTLAMSPRVDGPLAALCLHPLGFYDRSFAGAMVPTDDVIAHLLLIRSDEAFFWRKANQHDFTEDEAGI
jgi:hypothetical protein